MKLLRVTGPNGVEVYYSFDQYTSESTKSDYLDRHGYVLDDNTQSLTADSLSGGVLVYWVRHGELPA
jgi:hypothetical protein